jgi:hypothetical protein
MVSPAPLTAPAKKPPDSQLLASAILAIGSGAWKALSAWSNVDFLLSIREERFAVIFEVFQNTGWIILIIIGVVWGALRVISKRKTPIPDWSLVASCSLITFMFGALVAVRSSGTFPQVISGFGSPAPNCVAVLATSRLRSFRDDYKIALACGFADPTRDQLEDDRITVSNLFDINPNGVSIVAPYREKMRNLADQLKAASTANPGAQTTIWHIAILLPNNVEPTQVNKLRDVIDLKGKILTSDHFR